jgi:WD40 repeat protein
MNIEAQSSRCVFFPCGQTFVTCTKYSFRFFEVVTGNEIRKPIALEKSVTCFVCDGNRIVSGSLNGFTPFLCIFDITTGEKKNVVIELKAKVVFVCLSPAGNRIVTVSQDGFARIFEFDTRKKIFVDSELQRAHLHVFVFGTFP